MNMNMKTIMSTIVLGSIFIAGSVSADTPSGNDIQDTAHNAATGFLSGVTSIVSDTAANSIKNYANQPDSTTTSISADVGKVTTLVVGVDIAVAKASILASKAVAKSAKEVSEAVADMAIKQNNASRVTEEAMEGQKIVNTAMENAAKKLGDAADALKAKNQ